jgi:virginiamycin B lyase
LGLISALASASCGGSGRTHFGTMSQLRRDRVSAVIDVGGAPNAPDWQAQATDAVWVANSDKGTIQRIDPKTNRVTDAPATIKQPCAGLVVAFASVWSEDCGQNEEIVRLDERSGRELARISVIPADSEGLVTATQTAVYVVSKDASSVHYFVAKIDPTTNKIVRKIPVAPGAVAAAAGFGSVWVANPFVGTVTRIDAASDRVTGTTKTQKGARFLATGEGAVWILNQSDGSVSKLDPGSGNVVATIPAKVPGEGGCIATGLGSVWVTMPQTPVLRIDPKSNKVIERWTGAGGDCISVGFGSVWLSNHDVGNVWRIKP